MYSFCSITEIFRKKVSNKEGGSETPESVSGLLGGTFPLSTSLHSQEHH